MSKSTNYTIKSTYMMYPGQNAAIIKCTFIPTKTDNKEWVKEDGKWTTRPTKVNRGAW